MAANSRWRQTFLPVILEVEYASKIAISISDILSFWSMLLLKYGRRYGNFKIWPTLWPGDIIKDVMNTDLCKYSHNLMIHLYPTSLMITSLFIFSYHEKCSYLIFKGMWRIDLRPTCDVIDDVITMKNTFFLHEGCKLNRCTFLFSKTNLDNHEREPISLMQPDTLAFSSYITLVSYMLSSVYMAAAYSN